MFRLQPALAGPRAGLVGRGGRVEQQLGATVLGVAGRERWGGRVGRYLHHDELGAGLLERAGSDPLTVAWAREHHLPRERWTVPLDVGDALKAADDC